MSDYGIIDTAVVCAELVPICRAAKGKGAGGLTSSYRGEDPAAAKLLAQVGEIPQWKLYWGWVHGIPGYNPANPPNRTTHARFNDGVAYPDYGVGALLPPEFCGMDWGDGARAVRALESLRVPAHQTYPWMGGSEQQHVNLTHRITGRGWLAAIRAFIASLRPKPHVLHHGDRGLAVRNLARKLHTLGYYHTSPKWNPPSFFTGGMEGALRIFQKDHGMRQTGQLDAGTEKALNVAWNLKRKGHT